MSDPRQLPPKQTGTRPLPLTAHSTVKTYPYTNSVRTDNGRKYYVQPVVSPKVIM